MSRELAQGDLGAVVSVVGELAARRIRPQLAFCERLFIHICMIKSSLVFKHGSH